MRESYDGFSFTTLVAIMIVSRIIKKVYHKTMKAKTDTKKWKQHKNLVQDRALIVGRRG